MFSRVCHVIPRVVIGLCLWGISCRGAAIQAADQPAEDLQLDPAHLRKSQALSKFAWGLLLTYQGEKSPTEVAPHFMQALETAPESELVFRHAVTPWLMHKQYAELIAALGPVARANPEVTRLQVVYAEALRVSERLDDAVDHLQWVLEQTAWQDDDILREVFTILWRTEHYDSLERLLKRARRRRKEPDFVTAHAEALFYSALADTEEIVSAGEGAVKKAQRRGLKAARRAMNLAASADREEDILSLGQVLVGAEALEDALALVESVTPRLDSPRLVLLKMRVLENLGRIDDALDEIERLRQGERWENDPYLLEQLARLYVKAGKGDLAAEYLEQALGEAPQSLALRFQLTYLYLRLGEPQKGLALLAPLKQLPPPGYLLLAQLQRAMERNDLAYEALTTAETAAANAADEDFADVDFLMFFAGLCEDMGRTDEAIERARRARELAPESPMVANFLGYVLADHNQELAEAEGLIAQAVAAEPENAAYLDSLAWVYFRQGRFADALNAINRTLDAGRHELDPVILDHAGDIYAANGLAILARHFWLEAIARGDLRPDLIEEKIRRLQQLQ